jgi:protein-tyrosine phosphatase
VRRLGSFLCGGKAVAIHCRQGVGRSALVAACVLASLGERPDGALERVARARGCPVPDTAEQREWVLRFAERHLKASGGTTLLPAILSALIMWYPMHACQPRMGRGVGSIS